MDEDADIAEFVPWAHFSSTRPPSRWLVGIMVAGLVVAVAGVGVYVVNRKPPTAAPTGAPAGLAATTQPNAALLSEQDLQPALSGADPAAEEFVLDYFTRVGDDPTYVEWARSTAVTSLQAEIVVTVRYRLLVGQPFVRMPVRVSEIVMRWVDDNWLVVGLPTDRIAAPIDHSIDEEPFALNEYGFRVAKDVP